jgi:mono/diheme cytochrome c family protein
LQGPITVMGQEWANLAMVPWKGTITDEEIAAVVTFIRQNKDWGHNASAVTAEQVKAISDAETRAEPWTAADLEKIPVN